MALIPSRARRASAAPDVPRLTTVDAASSIDAPHDRGDCAIYLIDLAGHVQSWNAGAERIKGYRAEEILGSHFSRFFTNEAIEAQEPARALAIARSTGTFDAEGWRVRKDGTRFWADVVIDAVKDARGDVVGFVKITRDVTERAVLHRLSAQYRDEASRSAEQLAGVHEANRLMAMAERVAKVGFWRYDPATRDLFWSDEMYRIHGLMRSHRPTLETALSMYAPGERERIGRHIEHAVAEGTSFSTESRVIRPDGSIRNVLTSGQGALDLDGRIVELFGVLQDITERIDAERERERLIARVNAATKAGRVGIWDWDLASGKLVWDKMTFALYGLEDGAFSPTIERCLTFIHDEDAAETEAAIARAVADGGPLDTEYRIVWPSGEVRFIHAIASVLHDENGSARQLIGTVWDVTEIRVLGEELRLERERLSKTVNMWMAAKEAADEAQRTATLAAARDPLTGLLNRRGFEAWIEARTPGNATLLYIDIDGFKAVNDRGGHAAGDVTLQNVARVLQRVARRSDRCARMGGDEFVLVLSGVSEETEVQEVIARIEAAVEVLRPLGYSDETRIALSIGIARLGPQTPLTDALRQADAHLYARKRNARPAVRRATAPSQ